MDNKTMLSVGIDIGTSTSQVIFSQLTVENTAGYFSVPSISIIDKKVVYQSPIYRTPMIDASLIDGDTLEQIIEKEYNVAGVNGSQVETGAVIITGESARKENARMVLEKMSHFAGDFVVSTAGPDLESVIAGQGSGAQQFSEENGVVVVNLDIGGGTTNVVLFDSGEVCARGCLDIGGRQVTVDRSGRIHYISPSAAKIAQAFRADLKVGEIPSKEMLKKLCEGMNQILEQMLGLEEETYLLEEVRTAGSQQFQRIPDRPIQYICFSGGVADCIYHTGQDSFAYRDIGVLLGEAIRQGKIFHAFKVIDAAQTIRATVIGAGNYTTTISGSTIAYSDGLFPMKNIPVLKLIDNEEEQCWLGNRKFLENKAKWFLSQNDSEQMVLALEGKRNPDYPAIKLLAETLIEGMDPVLREKDPLIIIVKEDIAKALGQLMKQLLRGRRPVVSVDAIKVRQNNFVDFGRPIMNGLVIPVIVKTLIFG